MGRQSVLYCTAVNVSRGELGQSAVRKLPVRRTRTRASTNIAVAVQTERDHWNG